MVNYHILNDSIVLNYNAKTVVVARGDTRFDEVIEAIRAGKTEDIPGIVEIERGFTGYGIELRDGILLADGVPMPDELSKRILKFREERLPYKALLNFWDRLKKNPSYNARKMLFAFIENNGHPLTEDGCFIAYRGVTEDFKDVHTKSFDNKPGSICSMERTLVDDNPNNTCSSGLHVACYDYAKSFGPKLVEVKVSPEDVVCVPVDYNGTKMRTCKFEVIQECAEINTGLIKTFEEPEEDEGYCASCPPIEKDLTKSKRREVNGKGKDRQLRHAVRGANGRFVSNG